ncbi:MAG: glycosyltransferase [Bacteroidales bacterium]|nr:glycosyltransferase [Bacteroidales bacterium]
MDRPLHILFLPRWYPNKYDPMLGLFVRRHAEAAAILNKVSVVFAFPAKEKMSKIFSTAIADEGNLFTVNVLYKKSLKTNPLAKLINLIRFFHALHLGMNKVKEARGKTDLIHVHILTRLSLVAWWMKIIHGIPYLITEHWSRYLPTRNEFGGILRKSLSRLAVKNAGMVTAVTENLALAMQNHGLRNDHYVILPNVVDMDLFLPKKHAFAEKIRLIHISCFEDRSKNISGLLRVLKKLSEIRPDTECVLIGEGMDQKMLKDYAKSLGLAEPFLQFTGLLEGKKLAETLGSGDFLLLFSNYENMPVVILEAFACGLPVIATEVGGIPEMVKPENGMLVKAADEDTMLQAILEMAEKHKDYNHLKIRQSVEDQYSKKAVGELLTTWYQKVLISR